MLFTVYWSALLRRRPQSEASMKLPVHKPPGAEPGEEDVIEAIDVRWSEPPSPPPSSESGVQMAVPRISDSTPPDEETHLTDLRVMARVLDLHAIPHRIRIEMVSFPLSRVAWDLLSRIDGKTNLQELFKARGLPVDEGLPIVQQLFQSGMIAFR
jgi:hypothetical protein